MSLSAPHAAVRPTPPLGIAPIGVDGHYSAFPGACQYPDGTIRLVWRQGSNHAAAYDGVIMLSASTDQGLTWSTATQIGTGTAGSVDLRDPSISLSADATTSYLTYFKATPSSAGAGCFVRTSTDNGLTWGAETRIDSGLSVSCITAPLVVVGTTLWAVFYGRQSGEAHDSCWASTSTDGGVTWSAPNRLCNGVTAGFDYQEPRLIASGSTLAMFFRYGTSNAIGSIGSGNSGASFSAPAPAFANASGRPSAVWLGSGTIVVSYRSTVNNAAYLRASKDNGVTWLPAAQETNTVAGTLGMTYSSPIQLASGAVFCPVANEFSATSSKLYTSYLVEGPGTTPLGDQFLGEWQAARTGQDQVLYADRFSYADGPLPTPWSVPSGGLSTSNGLLVSTFADNTPDYGIVAVGTPDVHVEADLMWTGSAGVAVIARWTDINNWIKFTVETGGSKANVYIDNAGTVTNPISVNFTTIAGTWLAFNLMVKQSQLYAFINGYLVGSVAIPAGTAGSHGVMLNAQSGGAHYCRRFLVRS